MAVRTPSSRIRRAVAPLALCAGLTVGLTACGADPDEGTNGVGKLSAPEIEQKAQSAADAAKAVRLSGTLVSKGGTFKLNMRLKQEGAAGSVTTKNSTFELLRIGDALYLKADADFWAHDDKATEEPSEADTEAADKLDDMYVKVPQGDPSYKQFRGFTDMDVLLGGLIGLHGEKVKGDRDQIGGVRTIAVQPGMGTWSYVVHKAGRHRGIAVTAFATDRQRRNALPSCEMPEKAGPNGTWGHRREKRTGLGCGAEERLVLPDRLRSIAAPPPPAGPPWGMTCDE
ncbi:hypothetical protein [Streptomyces narbonensis]